MLLLDMINVEMDAFEFGIQAFAMLVAAALLTLGASWLLSRMSPRRGRTPSWRGRLKRRGGTKDGEGRR